MNRFAGPTVFVTGGNKGIGRGIATRFAAEGAKVAIAAIERDTPDAASAIAAAQTEADKWRAGKRIMARWGSSNGSGMPGLVEGAE